MRKYGLHFSEIQGLLLFKGRPETKSGFLNKAYAIAYKMQNVTETQKSATEHP